MRSIYIMMNTWIYIMVMMFVGNFILQMTPLLYYFYAVFIVHAVILGASYVLLKRDPLIDLRPNMLFMVGLTVINVLTDLGIMSYQMSWVAFGALFIWSMMGGGKK